MKTTIQDSVKETVLLWTTNLGAIGIGIADFNALLTTISLSLAIGLTIYNQYKKIASIKSIVILFSSKPMIVNFYKNQWLP